MKNIALSFIIIAAIFSCVWAGDKKPLKAAPADKCAVCGMFVAKYPDFLAQIVFKDGSYAMFDGPKDMFKYYLNMKTYNPSKKVSDIDSVYVTDYYTLTAVDGLKAYFVIGSNINGPMGRELIPFIKEADAREFMKDHNGRAIVRFSEVTSTTLRDIDSR
ncbi:MAG TPA: nitrous oxide reductase accessory protein NosL [Dissulfurispiraceae bacterium]|nr:nitrous oxide reductase accessory protein NosL [Dissulfurispiraceae bacterium]